MKTAVLLFTFLFILTFSFAQELKLKYEINMKSDDPEMQMQLQMSEGSTLTIYSKDANSRVEMNMGGLMKTTTVLDMDKKKGLIIMDGMFGKQAATFAGGDFDKHTEQDDDVEIEFLNETKEILGYLCKKAIVSVEEEDAEVIFWYTEELDYSKAYLVDNSKYKIPGVALEYSIEQPEVTMKFTAVLLEKSVKNPKEIFSLEIPKGYTEKSFFEISNMSGQ